MKVDLSQDVIEQLKAAGWTPPPEPEKKQWSPKGGDWFVGIYGEALESITTNGCREFGVERQTQEAAEKAAKAMRSHNRLLAWVAENDEGWEADWKNTSQLKWFVFLDMTDNKYHKSPIYYSKGICLVYMSEQAAEKLSAGLNDGSIVL